MSRNPPDAGNQPTGIEVQLQVPSNDWLEVYGLLVQSLTLDQLLPTLGFHQSTGHVDALQRDVSSQYADGLFVQHQDSTGKIYNLCGANANTLNAIENDLQKALSLFKERHNWLTSASRLSFGVVYERKVVVLLDTCVSEDTQLKPFLDVAVSVTKEQLCRVDEFNVICCSNGMEMWNTGLTQSNEENIASAVQWVEDTTPQTTPFKTNVVEGIVKALAHSEAEGIYLLANGECTLRAIDLLLDKVSSSLIPVHLVVFNCKSPQALEQYKQLASASGGRFHAYAPPPMASRERESKRNPLISSFSSLSSASAGSRSPPLSATRPASGKSTSSVNKPHPQPAVSIPPEFVLIQVPNDDLLAIIAEIELTRNTLAEVQALRLEIGVTDLVFAPTEPEVSEDSLTSQQWLQIHGIKAKKLQYEDLASSFAFQHCNGIVQIPTPKYKEATQTIEVVPHAKIIHAQYCKDFVHIRWNGDKTVHVQLTKRAHKTHRAKVESIITRCEERVEWLKKGSRQLFGTVLESKVVIVIDTSSSVKERLKLIKRKVEELLQEQLSQKREFTLIHFNSEVHAWRNSLVPTSPQNLQAVGLWVQGLLAEGSTNTLGALEMAMSVREAEAVYLLTDGRPDQPLDEILARVQQLPKIPVHTISFNCADSKANFFLAQLASNTGGRYYYFSEDASDPDGPNTYQSEDIHLLEEEVEYGHEQLQLADHLLSECSIVRKRGKKRGGRKGTKTAPTSRRAKTTNTTGNKLIHSKKWLEKNSLSALHLTLMDAFGPASIPHSSKHVPLLGKHVSSKVFNSLFPLAHVTNDDQVTLIHPNGVNLVDYETNLDKQVEVYWNRLSRLAWSALPAEKRSSLVDGFGGQNDEGKEEGEEVEPNMFLYKEHRDKLREALSDCNWPCPQEDFDLLEREINLGSNFKKYLKALKKEAERSRPRDTSERESKSSQSNYQWSDGDESVVGLYSPVSNSSLMSLMMDQLATNKPSTLTKSKSKQVPCRRHRKGQHVVVRPEDDAFYYPGVVVGYADRKRVVVELADKAHVTSLMENIIIVGGAGPCPMLSIDDYVLARVRTKRGPHPPDPSGLCDCYIPGVIQGLPDDPRKGTAMHLVLAFCGKGFTCSRHGIIKISKSKYQEICRFIEEKGTCPPTAVARSGASTRNSIYIPQVDEPPLPSPHPPHTHSRSRPSSAHSVMSRSGSVRSVMSRSGSAASSARESRISSARESRLSSARSSGSKSTLPRREKGKQNSSSFQESEEMTRVLEQQKAQGELLEQQQRELSIMILRQQELEAEIRSHKGLEDSAPLPQREEESPDFFQSSTSGVREDDTVVPPSPVTDEAIPTPTESPSHRIAGHQSKTGSTSSMEGAEATPPTLCEQAVNTDVWTEEKGTLTDPITESRGVGTEWNDSSAKSESDSDGLLGRPHGGAPAHSGGFSAHNHVSSTPVSSFTSITIPTPSSSPFHSPDLTPPQTPVLSSHPEQHSNATPTSATPTFNRSASITLPQYYPEEEDPLINQHVLARWPDDGWYYRALVVRPLGKMWYQVEDASQDTEKIHALDIVIDLQDAQKPLLVGDTVAALHPSYDYSYAPGKVIGMASDGFHFSIKLYDGTKAFLPRQEIYHLAPAKHQQDVEYLWKREKAWVGQAVLARRDNDGLYLPGEVLEQSSGTGQYVIEWADRTTQVQEITHMFGKLTKKRGLRQGDHVLALAVLNQGVYMPATIQEKVGQKLLIEFCDGEKSLVKPVLCFWLSPEYYQEAVEFIADNVSASSSSVDDPGSLGSDGRLRPSATDSDVTGEYSASYLH